MVPLRADLVADTPPPPRPPLDCTTAGEPTLCNRDLAGWLLAYDAALADLRARMAVIRALQTDER